MGINRDIMTIRHAVRKQRYHDNGDKLLKIRAITNMKIDYGPHTT